MAKERPSKRELERLYHDEGKTMSEVGDSIGVSETTVYRWMDEVGVNRRKRGPRASRNPATYYMDDKGYMKWVSDSSGHRDVVAVHRLLAVAEHGFDAVKSKHVHHESNVPWDNRPGNLTPLEPGEHNSLSRPDVRKRKRDSKGRFA